MGRSVQYMYTEERLKFDNNNYDDDNNNNVEKEIKS